VPTPLSVRNAVRRLRVDDVWWVKAWEVAVGDRLAEVARMLRRFPRMAENRGQWAIRVPVWLRRISPWTR
jgi:hypothetical protein